MIKTFTEDDLIRFIYNDINQNEQEKLQQALNSDSQLQFRLDQLKELKKDLDGIKLSPSNRTVSKILDYSKDYHKQSV